MPDIHPQLEPLAFLIGTWEGSGRGVYPTIDDFSYEETVSFTHDGRPFLAYEQLTRHPETGAPMHRERGFWKVAPDGSLEVVIAGTTGHVEVSIGSAHDGRIELASVHLLRSPTAKEVSGIERRFELDSDTLRYSLSLEAVGQPMQGHLEAVLRRVG